MQAILAFAFGYLTDLSLLILKNLEPDSYVLQLAFLLLGCVILAFGVYLELLADVVMISGDAFIKAIAIVTKKEYGNVKIICDISMTVISAVIALIVLHKLVGVREGTVIAALIVGVIIKFYQRCFRKVTEKILPLPKVESDTKAHGESNNFIITISREYGSGGRNIGNLIASRLGVKCYDEELIRMAAEKTGLSFEFAESNEQKLSHLHLYDFYEWYSPEAEEYDLKDLKKIKDAEEQVIRALYDKESCVIVGRQANSILHEHKNVINIFISADREDRINRIIERDGLSRTNAAKKMDKVDKQRKNYGKEFYHMEWRNCNNYDLSFNTSKISAENIADAVIDLKGKIQTNSTLYR